MKLAAGLANCTVEGHVLGDRASLLVESAVGTTGPRSAFCRSQGRRKPIARRSAAGLAAARPDGRRPRGTSRLRSSGAPVVPRSRASSRSGTSSRDAMPRRRSSAELRWRTHRHDRAWRRASRLLASRRRLQGHHPERRRDRPRSDDRTPQRSIRAQCPGRHCGRGQCALIGREWWARERRGRGHGLYDRSPATSRARRRCRRWSQLTAKTKNVSA